MMKHVLYCYSLCSLWTTVHGWMHTSTTTTTTTTTTTRRRNLPTSQYAKKTTTSTLDQHADDSTTIPELIATATSPPRPLFWHNTSDPILFHYDDDDDVGTLVGLQFRIRGNPMPLQRHRQTRRGFVYNPSSSAQTLFAQVLETQLLEQQRPLFPTQAPLHMSCHFCMKRSLSDFVANTRGRPLKASKRLNKWSTTPRTPDVDNLAKFVLDSFHNILYEDDQQIVSLSVRKVRDNEGDCLGYTDIHISVVKEESVE